MTLIIDPNFPTEPGYYWWRDSPEDSEWEPVEMLDASAGPGIVISGATYQPEEVSGKWGPRIPEPGEKSEVDDLNDRLEGMVAKEKYEELRDMFAAASLDGLLSSGEYDTRRDKCAAEAYQLADAMMAEREKRNA
jgi:hypothetical protein